MGLIGLALGYASQYAWNVSASRALSSPELAGQVFQTIAFVQFLALLGRAGLDRISLRAFGAAHGKHDGTDLPALWRRINVLVIVFSVVVSALAFLLRRPILEWLDLPVDDPVLPYLFFAGPMLALSFTASQALRGVGWVGRATLAQLTLVFAPPALVAAGFALLNGIDLAPLVAVFCVASLAAAVMGYFWTHGGIQRSVLRRDAKQKADDELARTSATPQVAVLEFQDSEPTRIPPGAISFFMLGLLGYAQAGLEIVLLGAWSEKIEVTRYIATARTAMFVGLGLVAIATVLGRLYAAAHAREDSDDLRATQDRAGRWALAFAVGSGGCLLLGHQLVLDLFGLEYPQALICFGVILLGHTINAGAGGLFLLLQMTGRERASTVCLVIATAIGLLAYRLLIPPLGAIGAALGLATLMSTWNLLMAWVSVRDLHIQPFSARLIPGLVLLGASYVLADTLEPQGWGAVAAIAVYLALASAVVWRVFLDQKERDAVRGILKRGN